MVDNPVQCPVCTLYLHAGMNLSDHLETHPKEQVIKALVQITIAGHPILSTSDNDAAAIDSKPNIDVKENFLDGELDPNSNSSSTSTLASTTSTLSNFERAFMGCTSSSFALSKQTVQEAAASSSIISNGNNVSKDSKSTFNQQSPLKAATSGDTKLFIEPTSIPTDFRHFNANRYHQQQIQVALQKCGSVQQQQEQTKSSSQLSTQQQSNASAPQLLGTGQHQNQRGSLSISSANPPIPAPSSTSATTTTLTTTQQVSQVTPSHQSPLQQSTSGGRRQQMMQDFSADHNVKHMFPSALPPPPPLQLFTYSANQQLQHQKPPPPAYGAAISQIRSQQNSSKQNAISHPQKQHSSSHQNFISQQQQQHHHNRVAAMHSVDTVPSTSKGIGQQNKKVTELPPPPPPMSLATSSAKSEFVTALENLHFNNYVTDSPTAKHRSNSIQQTQASNSNSSKTLNQEQSQRHTVGTVTANSIPPALASFAAAANTTAIVTSNSSQSGINALPSASPTVLRYAESPVAHYLERDNGDFILQETPKHIVECVETDDGEFSVIERIYQSPPSVLHIHDDAGNDDEPEDIKEEIVDSDESEMKDNGDRKSGIDDRDIDQGSVSGNSGKKKRKEDNSTSRKHTKDHSDRVNANQPTETPTGSPRMNNIVATSPLPNSNQSTPSSTNSSLSLSSSSSGSGSSGSSTRKKSSKNSITVLSDVQLNLNEYLDLVGNLIASSNKKTYTASAPIPLVKVEKIDVDEDDFEMQMEQSSSQMHSKDEIPKSPGKKVINSPSLATSTSTAATTTTTMANNDETEELNERKIKIITNSHHNGDTDRKSNVNETTSTSNTSTTTTTGTTGSPQGKSPCSSNVTSVIRMATITPLQQHQPTQPSRSQPEQVAVDAEKSNLAKSIVKDENVAQDLSQPQLKVESKPPVATLLRRGPKKLIIKPKAAQPTTASSTAPSSTCADDQPTTSAVAQKRLIEREGLIAAMPPKVTIKSEPTGESFGIIINDCRMGSILEKQLKQNDQRKHGNDSIDKQKEDADAASTSSGKIDNKSPLLKEIKQEKNDSGHNAKYASIQNKKAAEDAHVLLEFANSKKHMPIGGAANFLSSSSIFSSGKATGATDGNASEAGNGNAGDEEFITSNDLNDNVVQEIVISSSYSSQSASDINLNSGTSSNAINVQQQTPGSGGQPPQQFTDYPFSFLYGGEQTTATKGSFSSVYQNGHDTTAATHASSSSNFEAGDDSTSTRDSSSQPQNRFTSSQGAAPSQWWYSQQAAFGISSDFEVGSMAVECNNVMPEDVEVSKYLDLDTCKREPTVGSNIQVVVAPSPTSTSSFITATTDSDGCYTNDALNIRTDEKMPAKGEISEQESNCDIENSWSQPILSENAQRFFKTSFPGTFQQENGWHQDDWTGKSFDLRLPLEASTSAAVMGSNSNGDNKVYSQQQSDAIPSTSKNKKHRRKRDELDSLGKNKMGRSQPTATVTSQQMMLLQQQIHHHHHPMHPTTGLQAQQTNPTFLTPSSSTAAASQLMAGPSTASAVATLPSAEQKQRKKVYQCAHCSLEFAKLKDRNSHLIKDHNYVRQNRKLVSAAAISTTISSTTILAADTTPASCYESLVATSSVAVVNEAPNVMTSAMLYEDTKHSIVKMEIDISEPQQLSSYAIADNVEAKSEFVDRKDNLQTSLEPLKSEGSIFGRNDELERKPTHLMQPLALTTPATKLATLYRMLVSFNISTLKQNRNLSENDEKLIENSIFFCYICRSNFTSVKQYDLHLTEHPAECFTCGKKFQRWKNFSLHLKRHIGWKEFGCNVCDKKFVVRSALVEHMRMHTGQTPLKCKICGKYFKRYSNLTQHRKRHTRQYIRKKEYVCHCGEVLPSKARFLWHKETHDAKPKCCPYCCDRFVHANSLRRHIRLAHSDKFDYTEPMECPMCKQIFAKSSIKAHMATHSMDTQHDCAICNKTFSTKWNLKIHSWVHANRTAKPFKCEHCPKAFVREVDFKNHLNAHRQIKPYTCEYCGCKFIRKYNYMRHRREHHGNKKFTCDICKKSFHRHYYLIEHRRIHTGERPFQCNICGKSSTTKTNHNKHLKIHHSRDPFTVEA